MVTLRLPIELPSPLHVRTVLLVSADSSWREAARDALAGAGYHVIAVRHGDQALVESSRYATVDVVIGEGDFGEGGLPARLFREHPDAKVLHFSTHRPTREELLDSIGAALK